MVAERLVFHWTRGGLEDRWHGAAVPGAYEWWGFEAMDRDAGLSISLRLAAGDPIDPVYVGQVVRQPEAAASLPQNNLLVRLVVYQDSRRILARTTRPGPETFAASRSSGAVRVGVAKVEIEETASQRIYRVEVAPCVRLRFSGPAGQPAATGEKHEPVWDLASLGLAVEGEIEVGEGSSRRRLPFHGQGVHEHGFGPGTEAAVRSWSWGWAHAREFGVAWRQMVTATGEVETLLAVDRDGEPFLGEEARSRPFRSRYSLLGIPYRRSWRLDTSSGAGLAVERLSTLASSPLGMRFLANVRFTLKDANGRLRLVDGLGMSSVARPWRAGVAPMRWLNQVRDIWTSRVR